MGGPFTDWLSNLTDKIVDSKVGPAVERGFISGEAALRHRGPISSKLTDVVKQIEGDGRTQTMTEFGNEFRDMKLKPGDAKNKELVAHAKGQPSNDPQIQSLAQKFNALRAQKKAIISQATRVKLPESTEFPMYYDESEVNRLRPQLVKLLRKSGQTQFGKVGELLSQATGRRQLGRVASAEGPFVDLRPVLEPRSDAGVMLQHIHDLNLRIQELKHFGGNKYPAFNQALNFIAKPAHLGGEGGGDSKNLANFVTHQLLHWTGDTFGQGIMAYRRLAQPGWERKIMGFEAASGLSLAAITHLPQFMYATLIGASTKPTIKTFARLFSNHDIFNQIARDSGVAFDDTFRESKALAKPPEALWKGVATAPLKAFDTVRFITGRLSSNIGRDTALQDFETFSKAPQSRLGMSAENRLRLLGIDPLAALQRQSLSPHEISRASTYMSDLVTMRRNVLSLPTAWNAHPATRLLMIFKSYLFMAGKLVKDFAMKPALDFALSGGKKGSLMGLGILGIMFPSFGEVTQDLKELIRRGDLHRRPPWRYPVDRWFDDMTTTGGLGIARDAIFSMLNPDVVHSLYEFVGGRIPSDVFSVLGAAASKHHKIESVAKVAAGKIPVAGSFLRHILPPHRKEMKDFLQKGHLTKMLGLDNF